VVGGGGKACVGAGLRGVAAETRVEGHREVCASLAASRGLRLAATRIERYSPGAGLAVIIIVRGRLSCEAQGAGGRSTTMKRKKGL